MDALLDLANHHNLRVIEDCAHAIESLYQGRHTGTFGDLGAFSFYVTKNVVTGEGGMLTTADQYWANRIKIFVYKRACLTFELICALFSKGSEAWPP